MAIIQRNKIQVENIVGEALNTFAKAADAARPELNSPTQGVTPAKIGANRFIRWWHDHARAGWLSLKTEADRLLFTWFVHRSGHSGANSGSSISRRGSPNDRFRTKPWIVTARVKRIQPVADFPHQVAHFIIVDA